MLPSPHLSLYRHHKTLIVSFLKSRQPTLPEGDYICNHIRYFGDDCYFCCTHWSKCSRIFYPSQISSSSSSSSALGRRLIQVLSSLTTHCTCRVAHHHTPPLSPHIIISITSYATYSILHSIIQGGLSIVIQNNDMRLLFHLQNLGINIQYCDHFHRSVVLDYCHHHHCLNCHH